MNLKRFWLEILALLGVMLLVISAPVTVPAFEIETNSDVKIHWDTTLKYGVSHRVAKKESALVSPAEANADDGDRNFNRSLISNRFDILSEADVQYHGYGARVSGAAWYDTVYNSSNSNDSPFTINQSAANPFNPLSVDNRKFADGTRTLMGRDAELLDAFVFGSGSTIGSAELPYDFRVGRYTLMWGESLVFTGNGVAAGQAPVDYIKALGVPGTLAKELFMPVTQVSGSIKVASLIKLMAYYQLEWRPTRLPASGSYFSNTDMLGAGSKWLLLPGDYGGPVARGADIKPPNSGQYGVGAMIHLGGTDYGLYFVQYDAKTPSLYIKPTQMYQVVYPEGIRIYGASFSTLVGDMNVGGEIGYHTNQPFKQGPSGPFMVTASSDNKDNPAYPVGRSAHAQVSVLAYPGPTRVFDAAPIIFETEFSRRLSIGKNPEAFDEGATRDFAAGYFGITPTWFAVRPGVDLKLPLSVMYNYYGTSSFDPSAKDSGNFAVGVQAVIRNRWTTTLNYTNYFGGSGRQGLNDRDFVSFYITYTI